MKNAFLFVAMFCMVSRAYSQNYTITTLGGHLIITDNSNNGETLTLTQSGTNLRIMNSNTSRTYSIDGGATMTFSTPADIPLISVSFTITVNAAGGDDIINIGTFNDELPSLTISGGTGDDVVNFTGDLTLIDDAHLDLDLQDDDVNHGADQVLFSDDANVLLQGSGAAIIKVSRNITFNSGSSLSTANGNLTLEANQQATPTSGDFVGIDVNNATVEATGAGIVVVRGKGGDAESSYDRAYQHGIWVQRGGQISGGNTSGNSTLVVGKGGSSTRHENIGVYVLDADSRITSSGGDVGVIGQGGGSGGSMSNYGVYVNDSGEITSGGTGKVSVEGTGGSSSGDENIGVYIYFNNARITSSGGDLSVTGQGGGSGSSQDNYGVYVRHSGSIISGGTGSVNVEGTGGNSTGNYSYGVSVSHTNARIASSGGNVSVIGYGGGNGSSWFNHGVIVYGGTSPDFARIVAGGNGNVSVVGWGGNTSNNGDKNYGVQVGGGALITVDGTGSVTVEGTGGSSSGHDNYGVYVYYKSARITSSGGDVSVTGQGGGSASSSSNYGVFVSDSGEITSGGTGTVSVEGTGGSSSGYENIGVYVAYNNARISSSGGNVSVTGQGRGSGNSWGNHGVHVLYGGEITSGGTGTVTIEGTGGSSSGNSNHGVNVKSPNARINSSGGSVSVTGQGGGSGSSANNYGVYVDSSGKITSGGTGTVSVDGAGGAGTGIDSHGVFVTGTNSLITSTNGAINITGTKGASTNVGVADIIVSNNGHITSTTTTAGITLTGTVKGFFPNTAGVDVSTDASQNLTLGTGSVLNLKINGTTVNTQYQQLNIQGQINLNNATLAFVGSTHTPLFGQTFTILENDGTDAIIGTFSGLPEGGIIANFLGSALAAEISYKGGSGNDVVLTCEKLTQTIVFNTLTDKGYGEADFMLSATGGASNEAITYTSDKTNVAIITNGNMLSIVGVGTTNITANQAGNDSYATAEPVTQLLTVTKRNVTITANGQSKTYGEGDPTLTYEITSGSLAAGDAFTGSLTRASGENVGSYAIGQGTLALGNNYNLTFVPADLTITERAVTVTAAAKSKTYGDDDHALTYEITSGSLAFDDTFTGSLLRESGEDVGSYAIGQGSLALGSNYNLTFVPANLTITERAVTVTAAAKSKTYGDDDPALTYEITSGSLAAGEAFTGNLTRTTGENVGSYAIGQGSLALGGNYSLTFVPANLTIAERAVTVIAAAKNKTYGDDDPALTYEITSGSLAFDDTFTGSLLRESGENVGSYAIGQGSLALGGNYSLTFEPANLTITERAVTVTAAAKSKTYGEGDPTLTYEITSGSLAAGDAFTGSLTRAAGENVGTYSIQQGTLALNSNYTITYVPANLTITERAVTVTAAAQSKTYGESDPALSYTITSGSLATGDAFTGSQIRAAGENVGTYSIQQGTLALNSNYSLTFVGADFTIEKATQTITIVAIGDKLVTDDAFEVEATTTSGLVLTYELSGPASIEGTLITLDGTIGTVTVTVSQAGNENYLPATAQTIFNMNAINKEDQTITFSALGPKTFGDADFDLTATSSSGLAVGYSSSNESVATISGTTVTIVGAGTTTITASQPGNGNYNAAAAVEQALTVVKSGQTITFEALASMTIGDASFDLTATASSGLVVGYTSSDENVATITGSTVTIVGAGTTTITASQLGNDDYNASSSVGQVLIVDKINQEITFPAIANRTFGDAAFALNATASSGLPITYTIVSGPATISGSQVTISGTGTVTIRAQQNGNGEFNPATAVERTFVISKAEQSITFANLSDKVFGDAPFTLTATATSGLAVIYASSATNIATITGTQLTIVEAGTVTITATQAGNENYNSATQGRTLTIGKANQTIAFNELGSVTFGGNAFELAAMASSGLPITYTSANAQVATMAGNVVTIVGAGEAVITASQLGNNNYNAAEAVRTLTVNKATQTINFAVNPNKVFGGADFDLTATSNAGLPVTFESDKPEIIRVEGSKARIIGAGTATITARQAGNNNYLAAAQVSRQVTVDKAQQVITLAEIPTPTYGDAPVVLSATSSSGLQVEMTSSDDAIATIAEGRLTIKQAGTVSITARQPGNANYQAVELTRQVQIKKAVLVVTADNKTRTYGQPNPAFTVSYTGFKNGDNEAVVIAPSATTAATPTSDVGSYPIMLSGGAVANYHLELKPGTLTITKAQATITFANTEHNEDGMPKTITIVTDPANLAYTVTFNGLPEVPRANGTFMVVVTISDKNYEGQASATMTIRQILGVRMLGKVDIQFYPNPARDHVTIESPVAMSKVSLYSLEGRKLDELTAQGTSIQMDVSQRTPGVYLLIIETHTGERAMERLVIHR